MRFDGEYEPSTWKWVRDQAAAYEASGGKEANTLRDSDMQIIVMTTVGHKTGKVRKVPLMRVEHEGAYAIVGSKGGAPANPGWVSNLLADPVVLVQDGPEPHEYDVRLAAGEERSTWWDRSVAVFPPYAEYQGKTTREIPLFIATRR